MGGKYYVKQTRFGNCRAVFIVSSGVNLELSVLFGDVDRSHFITFVVEAWVY